MFFRKSNAYILILLVSCITGCNNQSSTKSSIKQTLSKQALLKRVASKQVSSRQTLSKQIKDPIISQTQPNLEIKSKLPPSLIKYMEAALKNNKDIRSSQAGLLATQEDHNISKSNLFPKLNAVGSFNKGRSWSESRNDLTNPYYKNKSITDTSRAQAGLSLGYNIFKGGADLSAIKESDSKIYAAQRKHDATVQTVLNSVIQYYFELIAKQVEIELLDSLLKSRQNNIDVSKDMLNAGSAKDADVAQAQAGYAETEAKIAKAKAEFDTYKAKLEEITCIPVDKNFDIPEKILQQKITLKTALDMAIKYNPQILEANAKCQSAKATANTLDADFAPSLDLTAEMTGDYNLSTRKPDDNNFTNSDAKTFNPGARLSLNVPLVDGGKSTARKRQNNALVTQALIEKGKIMQTVKSEIISNLAYLDAAEKSIASSRTAIEAHTLALKCVEEEYQAGTKMMSNVLESQDKLFESKLVFTNATKDRFVKECTLLSLVGKLTYNTLKIQNTGFDYNSQFEQQKREAFLMPKATLRNTRK